MVAFTKYENYSMKFPNLAIPCTYMKIKFKIIVKVTDIRDNILITSYRKRENKILKKIQAQNYS